ncbi:MAG: HlyD family efflux transporter periplasmic adaptor subunit, partial [Defluviitaleaceae bacterium]|nr:HlyD family efflux transporter periplasmic adaptor subunit [Defluviitaleaceae bacterium]
VTTETLALSKMSLEDLENRLNSPQSQNIIAQREISVSQAQLEVDRIQKELDDFQELIDQNRTGLTERQRDDRKEEIERRLEAVTLNLRSAQIALENELIPVSDTQITNARLDISRTERSLADLESERENILLNISRQTTTNHEDRLNTYNRQLEAIDRNIRMTEETKLLAEINLVDIQNRLNSPQSQNNVSQRRINVSQAQLEVDRIERELSDFSEVLYSPISGTITDLRISQGEISPTERPLMEVSNIGEFVVRAFVNERNIARVELGQEVKIEANVLGRGNYATGIVTRIDQIAQTRQSTTGQEIVVPVEITVNPSVEASQLKPGFSLDVTITTSVNTDVVVVSILSTLTDADGNAFVFVVRDDNSLERRMVTTGAFADMYMEVIGLNAGETIVSQPTLNMYDGMIITAIR